MPCIASVSGLSSRNVTEREKTEQDIIICIKVLPAVNSPGMSVHHQWVSLIQAHMVGLLKQPDPLMTQHQLHRRPIQLHRRPMADLQPHSSFLELIN